MRKTFSKLYGDLFLLTIICLVCFSNAQKFERKVQSQSNSAKDRNPVQQIALKLSLWNAAETKLRGANVWQRLVTKKDGGSMGGGYIGPPYDLEKDFQKLKDWGANYVHISHPGIFFEKSNKDEYRLDEKSLANLRALVEACGRKGLYAVIAFRTGPDRNEEEVFVKSKVSDLWKNEKAQRAWEAMWRKTAAEFRNVPNVAGYDLMVEPELKIEDLDDPKKKREAVEKSRKWSEFANRLITVIRAEDGETPVLVGGIGMSGVDGLYLLDTNVIDPRRDRKIVYTVHQYEPSDYAQQTEGNWSFDCRTKRDLKDVPKPEQYKRYGDYENSPQLISETLPFIYQRIKDWRAAHETADYKPPLAITEFGAIRWAGGSASEPDAKIYLAKQLKEINDLKINYAIWKWDSSFCTGDDDYNFRHGEKFENHDDIDDNPLTVLIRNEWRTDTEPLRP